MCLPYLHHFWNKLSDATSRLRNRMKKSLDRTPVPTDHVHGDMQPGIDHEMAVMPSPAPRTYTATSNYTQNSKIGNNSKRKSKGKDEDQVFGEPQYLKNYYIDDDALYAKMDALFERGTYRLRASIEKIRSRTPAD
jgi:hypothetical protein